MDLQKALVFNEKTIEENMETQRDVLKYIQEEENWQEAYSTHKKICVIRLLSNVFYEIFSFLCLLAYLVLLGKWMNGGLTIKHSSFVWLLLPFSMEYGLIPYILLVFGFCFKRERNWPHNNIFVKTMSNLNGLINFRIYILLWHRNLGIRILFFGCIFITFILYVLFTFDIIKLGYCFIPLLVYSILFEITFLLNFNCIDCPESIKYGLNVFRIFHFLFLYSSLIVSCILTMIKLLSNVDWSYTILSIPWCISLGFIPIVNCCEIFFVCGIIRFIKWEVAQKKGIEYHETESLLRSFIDCVAFILFSPLLMTTIILFTKHLDSKVNYSYINIFIPLLIVISIIVLINVCLLFFCSCYRCPFYLCPDSFGIVKTIFCCTKWSKNPYYGENSLIRGLGEI